MCYSSLVERALKKLGARYRAKINIDAFVDLYSMRVKNPSLKIPLGMDAGAIDIGGMAGKSIEKSIREFRAGEDARTKQLLEDVHAEIAELELKLQKKITKTAQEKLEVKLRKRDKLLQSPNEPTGDSYRIFPFYFAPVIIQSGEQREIIPMRYQIKPRFPGEITGTFNARRDSLQTKKTWTPLFGRQHAIFPFLRFYEWVGADDAKREITFSPDGYEDMWAASVFDKTKTEFGEYFSFAMITDEPPPEVAAAGHDRCPVFIQEQLFDAWLQPQNQTLAQLDALLEQKQPTYFSHAMAA